MRYLEKGRVEKRGRWERHQGSKNRSGDKQLEEGEMGELTKEVPPVYSCLVLSNCSSALAKQMVNETTFDTEILCEASVYQPTVLPIHLPFF